MNLGLWTPYVGPDEMLAWYELPAEMQAECVEYTPDGHELDGYSAGRFASLRELAIAYADASVAKIAPAYHNPAHFSAVEREGMAAFTAYQQLTGRAIPAAVGQILSVALYTHDADHCGSTFRSQAPQPQHMALPQLGTGVSTEWVTALKVSRLLKNSGVNLPARMFQTKIHWASTYGGQTATGRALGFPNPDPQDLYGCIMRAADVCPDADFDKWVAGSVAVNYGETPAEVPPTTWHEFVQKQIGFSGYIEHCFDKLDTVAGVSLTQELGWRTRLAHIRQQLDKLAQGNSPGTAAHIKKELGKYGVTLR